MISDMERSPIDRLALTQLAESYGLHPNALRYLIQSGVRYEDLEEVLEARYMIAGRVSESGKQLRYPKMSALARAYTALDGDTDLLDEAAELTVALATGTDWGTLDPMSGRERISGFLGQAVQSIIDNGLSTSVVGAGSLEDTQDDDSPMPDVVADLNGKIATSFHEFGLHSSMVDPYQRPVAPDAEFHAPGLKRVE